MITNTRYHDFSYGHRVCGHENKCKNLHGHNGRVTFTCTGELDSTGRVIDFSVIKSTLCEWLEENWDHSMLLWEHDPMLIYLKILLNAKTDPCAPCLMDLENSIVEVPFNPTAENMAYHLLHEVGPEQLKGTGVTLVSVVFEETRKCKATANLDTVE